ncbi:olfactory receptor 10G4-like [Acipenser ruthenus]|uniref:olfactory receptor 10G4-like n=1 Tax=Acipenser ruthenus TaxID=7906 RepID=UPI00155F9A86|nr:olfactory receptor 10G4-like [Acipenser ruthenus]
MELGWKMQILSDSNHTNVAEFVFVGFTGVRQAPQLIGVTFLIIYLLTLLGNLFILYVIKKEEKLQTPMYIIICNLALSDIIYSTVISPKLIQSYLLDLNAIQFHVCFIQMYFFHFAGSVDSFMMLVMALDRYVSICFPLRYPALITNKNAQILCIVAWMLGAISPLPPVSFAAILPYCGPNKINHLYCEHRLVARLACTDTTFNMFLAFIIACLVLIVPFSIILLSYLKIIITVLKIATPEGRKKAFYTCSTQLIVISIFFIPRLFVYIASIVGVYMPDVARASLGVMYCLLPPLANPVIYSFRTKEIKQLIFKLFKLKTVVPRENTIGTTCA